MKGFLLILLSFFVLPLYSQTAAKADELFNSRDYGEALVVYEKLLNASPQSPLYQYRYARCLQETGQRTLAIEWFEKAGERYALRNYHLGRLYMEAYRFADASDCLNKYKESLSDQPDRMAEIDSCLAYCRLAERYLKRVEDIAVIDSAILPNDRILSFYNLSSESGSLSVTDGLVSFCTSLGDYKCSSVGNDSLILRSCINILGEWTDCDTLPENVNAGARQNYPFLLSDGVTLYFASDMAGGLGGYDIYVTRHQTDADVWFAPENLGYPFNSAANDYLYVIDEVNGVGWFATDRNSPSGYVTVYKFVVNSEKIIIKDADLARLRAQMLSLRYGVAPQKKPADEQPIAVADSETEPTEEEQTTIVITDRIVYHSVSEFRSPQARTLYLQSEALAAEISAEEEALCQERLSYLSQRENKTLASSIETRERKLLDMYPQLRELTYQMRQTEITACLSAR